MSDEQDLLIEASDPATSLERLAELAFQHPETRDAVAANPSSYQSLLDWLGALGDPSVTAALALRTTTKDVVEPLAAPSTAGEPSEPETVALTPVIAAPVEETLEPWTPSSPAAVPPTARRFIQRLAALSAAAKVGVVGGMLVLVLAIVIPISVVGGTRRSEPVVDVRKTSVPHSATSPNVQATMTPTPTPTAAPAPAVVPGAVWIFSNQAGYSYDMRFTVGTPTRLTIGATHPSSSTAKYGSACTVDKSTDLLIPVTWSGTATTAGYKTAISMRALIQSSGIAYAGSGIAPFDGDHRVSIEQYFTNGPVCNTESSTNIWGYGHSDGFSVQFTDPVSQGSSVRAAFTIIIKNYYTPATPNGDTALLDWISIRPIFGGDNSDAANTYHDVNNPYLGVYSATGVSLRGETVTY